MTSPFRATVPIRRSGEVPCLRHNVTLTGAPRSLRWPSACVCCGTAASERLPVTRVFDRDWRYHTGSRSADDFRIVAVHTIDVPVCRVCASRHHLEVRSVGPFAAALSIVSFWLIPSLVATLGTLLYFFPQLLGGFALVRGPGTAWQAAAFAGAAAGFALAAWYQTRPRRVTPPTTVTQAFDFSDNLAGLTGVERRVYGMDNESFARAFETANADRVWTGGR